VISTQALQALAALLEAYPELRGLLRDDAERSLDRPRRAAPSASGLCYRSVSWVCFRRDRQQWYVRWTVPDPTKRNHRRYGWRSFGKGDEGRAQAEAFHKALAPDLNRQWEEFLKSSCVLGGGRKP
jgi:hypothetical protein